MSQLTHQLPSVKTKSLFMYKRNAGMSGNHQTNMDTTTYMITITRPYHATPGIAATGKSINKQFSRFV